MPKTLTVVLILLVITILLAAAAIYIRPFGPAASKKTLTVGSQTFEVGVADTALSRAQGLSGRPPLGENEGLLFIFSSSGSYGFWMKDMNFPIDIIWINGGKVIGFSENLQPEPGKTIFSLPVYYPPGDVNEVLEINAGAVAKYGIKEGDIVNLQQ